MKRSNRYGRLIIWTTCVVALTSMIHILLRGSDESSVRFLIQWSAKCSATFFSVAFMASSVRAIFKNQFFNTWLRYRPHLGLIFTVFHTFHLLFLIWLQWDIHPVFTLAKRSSLLGGGMAYGFMYAMAITTFPTFKNKLQARHWKILHTTGGYWIWFIFIKTYWRNVSTRGEEHFLFGLLALVLLLRLVHLALKFVTR